MIVTLEMGEAVAISIYLVEKMFAEWKLKTADLASQQRYKWFLVGQILVASEEELETM